MEYKYYMLTILRNGEYRTIVDYISLIMFMLVEKEYGYKTFIINHVELSKLEYEYWLNNK